MNTRVQTPLTTRTAQIRRLPLRQQRQRFTRIVIYWERCREQRHSNQTTDECYAGWGFKGRFIWVHQIRIFRSSHPIARRSDERSRSLQLLFPANGQFTVRLGIGNHVNSTVYNEPPCMHFPYPRALKKGNRIFNKRKVLPYKQGQRGDMRRNFLWEDFSFGAEIHIQEQSFLEDTRKSFFFLGAAEDLKH